MKTNPRAMPLMHVGSVSLPCAWGQCLQVCGVSVFIVPVGLVFPLSVQSLCSRCVCGVGARVVPLGLVLAALGCSRVSPGCLWAGEGV